MTEPVPALPADLDPEVARWLEMAEARACRDTYAAAAAVPGNPMGAASASIGGATAFGLTAIDFAIFNRVVGLGVQQPATEDDVAAAAAFFLDLGLTQSAMHVSAGAMPAELPEWMAAHGYQLGGRWVKMWHDLSDLGEPPGRLLIEQIDASHAEAFARVCMTAFEMPDQIKGLVLATVGRPGWAHYLGFEGDTPVSTAASYVVDDIAWLGYGGTLEESRGRGWQTAMFRRRLQDSRDRGCRLAITETGEETEKDPVNHSYRNMVRTGFRLGYARRNWYRT